MPWTALVGNVSASVNGPVAVANQAGTQLATSTLQFTALSGQILGVASTVTTALNSFSYPSGLSAANFNTAIVAFASAAPLSSAGALVTVSLIDSNGTALWQQVITGFEAAAGLLTVPIPLTFGLLNGSCAIKVAGTANFALAYDIILAQEPVAPATLIAGVQAGLAVPGAPTSTKAASTGRVGVTIVTPGTSQFGPAAAYTARSFTLSVAVQSYTNAAASNLTVNIVDLFGPVILKSICLALPAASSQGAANIAGDFGVGGYLVTANGGLELQWIWGGSTPTAVSGVMAANVLYT